ncbi:MAG: alanine racemase [Actinomycetota bacterium]
MKADLPLWMEVDLEALRRNIRTLKSHLGPHTRLLAVVKANGYGHGDVPVALAAIEAGAEWLGIARVQEGASLRRAGITTPILLLAEPPLGAVEEAVELGLVPTIYTAEIARTFSEKAVDDGRTIPVHLKVDTGMHRYGVVPEAAGEMVDLIESLDGLELEGLWSHFAVAEEVDNPATRRQYESFLALVESLGPRGRGRTKHLANSAAILTFPESHLDLVRAGIAIYGIYPSPDLSDRTVLEPVMSLKSRVGLTKRLPAGEPISYGQRYTTPREATIATIPVGYADGLPRSLTNRGEVLIGGRRYRISGAVTMDHFLVDVGDDDVKAGDEVVILGRQGSEEITAQEIAERLGTIAYEVVCGVSARVERIYLEDASS